MNKILLVLALIMLVGCGKNEDLNQTLERENIEETEEVIEEIEPIAVSFFDWDDRELSMFKQRFLTLKMASSVSSEIDTEFFENLEVIKSNFDDESEEGYILDINLEKFIEETDKNFADLTAGYAVLVDKTKHLPFDYQPENLVWTTVSRTFDMQLEENASNALKAMFDLAKADGINLILTSAYRDFAKQAELFEKQVVKRGGSYEIANQYVALPGESEHQTGLVVDITCVRMNYQLNYTFEDTVEFEWLDANAHKFGYIMSYPKDRVEDTGYTYEPWHYRYVGSVEVATFIKENDMILEDYHEYLKEN